MKRFIPIFAVLMLFVQACGGSAEPVATDTTEAPVEVQATEEVIATIEAPATEAPVTEVAETAEATETAERIVHTIIPQGGTAERADAHDNENSTNFENKNVRFGDEFEKNRFERPFTANDMEYLPDLDIVDFGITSDDQFFYISIVLSGLDPTTNTLTGFYGVEIDRDADGRSELMLATFPAYSNEFTAENVAVLADLDGDIGGPTINRPDLEFEGNGYDGIIFDLSQNIHPKDPDLAWVRFVDGNRPAIEIAYRKWIFRGGDEKFMWSVFSLGSSEGFDPSKFNSHDTISEVEAGSPDKNNPNYPIKELASMDNTCRVPLGFQASGAEPLGCFVSGSDVAVTGNDSNNGSDESPAFCGSLPEVCNRGVPPPVPPDFVFRVPITP